MEDEIRLVCVEVAKKALNGCIKGVNEAKEVIVCERCGAPIKNNAPAGAEVRVIGNEVVLFYQGSSYPIEFALCAECGRSVAGV